MRIFLSGHREIYERNRLYWSKILFDIKPLSEILLQSIVHRTDTIYGRGRIRQFNRNLIYARYYFPKSRNRIYDKWVLSISAISSSKTTTVRMVWGSVWITTWAADDYKRINPPGNFLLIMAIRTLTKTYPQKKSWCHGLKILCPATNSIHYWITWDLWRQKIYIISKIIPGYTGSFSLNSPDPLTWCQDNKLNIWSFKDQNLVNPTQTKRKWQII